MKNKVKKILTLMLVVFTGFLSIVSAAPANIETEFDDEYLIRNWNMVELATKIENKIMKRYNIKETFEDLYPDYFGGLYVSDDARNLIIQIVEKNIPQEGTADYKFYQEITTLDEAVKIEYVNYSFNELNEVNNQVSTLVEDNENLTGAYIDIINNTTVVELDDNSMINQEKLKREIKKKNLSRMKLDKTDLITYKKGYKAENTAKINLNVGGDIGGEICSMGFRTRYNGYDGYVTAGHCVKNLYDVKTGKPQKELIQYNNNESFDYAFVRVYGDYKPTNILEYMDLNIMSLSPAKYSLNITVNMAIAKVGITTHYTTGKVTGLKQTIKNDEGVTIKGLYKSDLKVDKGDSGGAVFIPKSDANGGSMLVGITNSGIKGVLGIGRAMFFTTINDIPSKLIENRY